MARATEHQTKAEDNRQFLDSFDAQVHACWAAVVAFYTAVHLIEQLRALDGQHSADHQDRLGHVQSSHRSIHDNFKQLFNSSLVARYGSNSAFFAKFTNDEVKGILIDTHLVAIEQYVIKFIAEHPTAKKAK